jgi:choline dehydrogenase-like flavoprotein
MQVLKQPRVYDAGVIGSGAAGGMTALVLCRSGAKVLMLEAGADYDTASDSKMMIWPYEAPLRGGPTPRSSV